MNELKIFENAEFGQVRTVTINNEPYMVGKDISDALGYKRSDNAIRSHVDEEDKLTHQISALGQNRNMIVINESGLYSLVFGSELETAKEFKHWVTSEVLPSIRKNGGYIANQENLSSEQILANAVLVAQNVIAEKDKLITEMQPKVEFFDSVADSKTALPMDKVAKVLAIKGIGRNKLFEVLRENKILDRSNVPYQTFVDRGYFRVVEQKFNKPNGETEINIKTLVYQKGVDYIRKIVS